MHDRPRGDGAAHHPRTPADEHRVTGDRPRSTPTPSGTPTTPAAPGPADAGVRRAATRHRTRADERIAGLDISPTKLLADIEELRASLEEERARADEHLALAQRAAADYANLKRRTAEARERDLGLASEALLAKVVALADDFDLALEHVPGEARQDPWVEGIAAIDRKLRALLESEGVTAIDALGRQFDPREHEALQRVAGTGAPEGEVVAELRRGYRIRDRVLRAALVAVSDGTDGYDAGQSGTGEASDAGSEQRGEPGDGEGSGGPPGHRLN